MNDTTNRNGGVRRGKTATPKENGDIKVVSDEPTPQKGRGLIRLLLLLLVVGAAALLYHYWGFWRGADTAAAPPPPPAVTVAKPLVKEMMEWNDFTGQFEARESVEVRPRVSGFLSGM